MSDYPFFMHAVRSLSELMAMPQIEPLVEDIERASIKNAGATIDCAKALLECVCKTILRERGIELEKDNPELPALFNLALSHMQLAPNTKDRESKAIKGITDVLGGLNRITNGISVLRNNEGTISHGKDGDFSPLDNIQAQLVARSIDAAVHFIYSAHKKYPADPTVAFLRYGDIPDFDAYVDDANKTIGIFDFTYEPSKVLFFTDEQAYRYLLGEYFTNYKNLDEDE